MKPMLWIPLLLLSIPGSPLWAQSSCLQVRACTGRAFATQLGASQDIYQVLQKTESETQRRARPDQASFLWRLHGSTEHLHEGLEDPCRHQSAIPTQPADPTVEHLRLEGPNEGRHCGFFDLLNQPSDNKEAVRKALTQVNWDPCCLSNEIKTRMTGFDGHLNGFAVGAEVSGSAALIRGVGPAVAKSKEMVLVRTGPDSVQVALVHDYELSLGASLPLGSAVTQSILQGQCRRIGDYLGYFKSATLAGVKFDNMGMSDGPWNPSAHATGCNTETLVSGTSTPLISIAGSYARLSSAVFELRGPRIHRLLQMMDQVNADASARRLSKELPHSGPEAWGAPEYDIKNYTSPSCDDSLLSQLATHLRGSDH